MQNVNVTAARTRIIEFAARNMTTAAATIIVIISVGCYLLLASANSDVCNVTRCGKHGPDIRFPFRLNNDRRATDCGYAGFDLSCTTQSDILFEFQIPVTASTNNNISFPLTVKALVEKIEYRSQEITIRVLNACPPPRFPGLISNSSSSSSSPVVASIFMFEKYDYTLFNCTSDNLRSTDFGYYYLTPVTCLTGPAGYQVYAVVSSSHIYDVDLSFCTKMYSVSNLPYQSFGWSSEDVLRLRWSQPDCISCEAQGKYCKIKNNNRSGGGGSNPSPETECFSVPQPPLRGGSRRKLIPVVIVGCLTVLALVYALHRIQRKREDQLKIEKFLEDYKALRPTRYTYADIKKITEKFKYKLGQGGYGTVYKGQLSSDVFVAVKVLNSTIKGGEEFINEVGTIGTIHHVNVVRLVGYCADGFRRALVYEFLPNDSLQKFLSPKQQTQTASSASSSHPLSWEKLYEIAMGIAKGIEYLHQGCEQRILHFDIKPHNILLDHNLTPKVSDFGLAKLCSKEKSAVSMTAARGTMGYIAPEVFSRNFGNVSHKSDVYSFGMLLIEMVGEKDIKAEDGEQSNSSGQVYFPDCIYKRLSQGDDLRIQLENEQDSKIVKKLRIVGLWCIQWYPVDRPSMRAVVQMLEGEDYPTMPPSPFGSGNPTTTTATSRKNAFRSELEDISESELE